MARVVALRKESVDRNADGAVSGSGDYGRSPQESVDRNILGFGFCIFQCGVALRKESVDRNANPVLNA